MALKSYHDICDYMTKYGVQLAKDSALLCRASVVCLLGLQLIIAAALSPSNCNEISP